MAPKCEKEVNWVSVCLSLFLSTPFSFEVDQWVLHQSAILPTSLRLAWLKGRISRRPEGGRTVPYVHVCPQKWLWQIPKNDWGSGHTSVLGPSTQLLLSPIWGRSAPTPWPLRSGDGHSRYLIASLYPAHTFIPNPVPLWNIPWITQPEHALYFLPY